MPVVAAVVFFWLRELELTFLATYRIPIGIIVGAVGITLGIMWALFVRKNIPSLVDNHTAIRTFWIAILILLLGSIGLTISGITEIRDHLLAYWVAAQHTPPRMTALTGSLFSLLVNSVVFTYFPIFGFFLIWDMWAQRQAAQAVNC